MLLFAAVVVSSGTVGSVRVGSCLTEIRPSNSEEILLIRAELSVEECRKRNKSHYNDRQGETGMEQERLFRLPEQS
jgi:hypothetical protein